MEITALLLSRIQFAATVSFHIIFPSFTIGLAAWLAVLEAMTLATGNRIYREVFEFWLKIFRAMVGCGVIMLALAWFTAEVGRQPWTVWGVLRTADALTPGLSAHFAAATLALYVAVYGFIFCFGIYYIVRIVMGGVTSGKVIALWNGHAIFERFAAEASFGPQRLSAVKAPETHPHSQ